MARSVEQVDRHESSGAKRVMKKRATKQRRILERRNAQEAPTKNRYSGYTG
jgi:hypothetical protein